jgi:hypothetical protein
VFRGRGKSRCRGGSLPAGTQERGGKGSGGGLSPLGGARLHLEARSAGPEWQQWGLATRPQGRRGPCHGCSAEPGRPVSSRSAEPGRPVSSRSPGPEWQQWGLATRPQGRRGPCHGGSAEPERPVSWQSAEPERPVSWRSAGPERPVLWLVCRPVKALHAAQKVRRGQCCGTEGLKRAVLRDRRCAEAQRAALQAMKAQGTVSQVPRWQSRRPGQARPDRRRGAGPEGHEAGFRLQGRDLPGPVTAGSIARAGEGAGRRRSMTVAGCGSQAVSR